MLLPTSEFGITSLIFLQKIQLPIFSFSFVLLCLLRLHLFHVEFCLKNIFKGLKRSIILCLTRKKSKIMKEELQHSVIKSFTFNQCEIT